MKTNAKNTDLELREEYKIGKETMKYIGQSNDFDFKNYSFAKRLVVNEKPTECIIMMTIPINEVKRIENKQIIGVEKYLITIHTPYVSFNQNIYYSLEDVLGDRR